MPGIGAARRRLLQIAKPESEIQPRPDNSNSGVAHVPPTNKPDENHQGSFNKSNDKENLDNNQSDWTIGPEPIKDAKKDSHGKQLGSTVDESLAAVETKSADKSEQINSKKVIKNFYDPDQGEWNDLDKPNEERERLLREMISIPPEPAGDFNHCSLETKKHRLQMLLAEHKFGIPSLALADEYEKMYGHKLDVQEWGYEMLSSLIADMSDVITVQEPDEISCLYHPKYPNDRILLDKRYGHQFTSQPPLNINRNTSSGIGSVCDSESEFETLISRAKINHDSDFPDDVVLPGEQYTEPILIKTAQVEGTRGVYTCLITGAANPHHFYLNMKNDYTETIETFTSRVKHYFEEGGKSLEAYRVPEEFIYPGFACLRQRKNGPWERVSITGRSPTDDKILVESVDFGGTDAVSHKHLRLMPRKFMSAPRQAIVVSLFGVESPGGKWSSFSGQKIAGWSYEYYWMECLFLEPKPKESTASDSDSTTVEQQQFLETGSSTTQEELKKNSINKRIWYRKPQFEVIILDRMTPSYDAFIDEILVAQMLASYVVEYKEQLECLKSELKKAIADIPSHENPMEKSYRQHGHV